MSKQTELTNLFERYKKESGDSRIDKLQFIKDLNDLLQRMKLTKPAEQIAKIYYVEGYDKYLVPDDFREAIAIYSDYQKIIFYVSPYRFRLERPVSAFTEQVDGGVMYLKIRKAYSRNSRTLFIPCDNLTSEGAWSGSASVSNIEIDEVTKEKGAGSLSFSVSGTQATVTFDKASVVNAKGFTEKMRGRLYSWFPTVPSSVKIRFGSDSANYFEQEVTLQASGEKFDTQDSNELEFENENATEFGSVDRENMDFFEYELNFDESVTANSFRIDQVVLAKPEILDLEYYSNYVGIDANGNLIEKITEDINTTDEPIIKRYPDYTNTSINGLCFEHLRNKNPNRAEKFESEYKGIFDQRGKPIGGMALLNSRYPTRRANYKRLVELPPLNRRTIGGRRGRRVGRR